ncbi:uncharacterized protein B0H18DRAFT_164533 [Fomitopsis serialis]|uniref:uncharacterized protein n=1 Tax=Fomitopsis serialis TaxID=139415 RepID=UPI0020085B3A|nr:uncharacterized protein B0H18DRAFT_164533 [Neoantrodia serialis]KAH9913645.1 hypothetical protein B0H18DRAFT_164533 [Neoantrodia serialis]
MHSRLVGTWRALYSTDTGRCVASAEEPNVSVLPCHSVHHTHLCNTSLATPSAFPPTSASNYRPHSRYPPQPGTSSLCRATHSHYPARRISICRVFVERQMRDVRRRRGQRPGWVANARGQFARRRCVVSSMVGMQSTTCEGVYMTMRPLTEFFTAANDQRGVVSALRQTSPLAGISYVVSLLTGGRAPHRAGEAVGGLWRTIGGRQTSVPRTTICRLFEDRDAV